MNKAETVGGALFAALGVFMLVESLKSPYMLEGIPGPSFLPRWIAIGLVATGAIIASKAALSRFRRPEAFEWPSSQGWKRVGLIAGALAASFVVLDKLGFLVTTTIFIFVVIYGLGVRSWRTLAIVPLLAAIVLYVVFAVALSVPLPKGVLEILS